jgi:pimeloyl-ACP methyl ester carboxylesterase
MRGSHFPKRRPRIGRTVLALMLLVIALIALWPPRPVTPPRSQPFPDYVAARARVAERLANPPPEVREECRSAVRDHGHRTRDVYVLLHGLTNCPAQFRLLADELYARGANVLLLRLPHHGLRDRLTTDSALLTAQDLVDSAGEAVDLAQGYGERVIVIGLSVSGVSAAWIAQTRPDVSLVVSIAPFFAPVGLPDWAISPLSNFLRRVPNGFIWWDPRLKADLPGSPYSYPRFATHSIGEVMALGLDVFALAGKNPPAARRILFVTSPADTAISLPRVRELDERWKGRAKWREFPADWKVPHDCIDPAQPGARIDLVYPQLLQWIDAALP